MVPWGDGATWGDMETQGEAQRQAAAYARQHHVLGEYWGNTGGPVTQWA